MFTKACMSRKVVDFCLKIHFEIANLKENIGLIQLRSYFCYFGISTYHDDVVLTKVIVEIREYFS